MGRTKYEELFVVWKTVAARLAESGHTVVSPEVGELVTSLDMAGCSLTVMWLDDELERLWTAPADTPAYRKGAVPAGAGTRRADDVAGAVAQQTIAGDTASRQVAAVVAQGISCIAAQMVKAEHELGRIDAVAGDGDHGRGMVKGTAAAGAAAADAVNSGGGTASVLTAAGEAWAAKAGGTSGVLWGAALCAAAAALGNRGVPGGREIATALRAGHDALVALGRAQRGDKTMLDVLGPFVDSFEAAVGAGTGWRTAWLESVETAQKAAAETADLRPKVGRARPLAERSVGTPDAGAISLAMCIHTVAELIEENS